MDDILKSKGLILKSKGLILKSKGLIKIITDRDLRTGFGTTVNIAGAEVPDLHSFTHSVGYSSEGVVTTTVTLVIAGDEVVTTHRRN